MPKSCKCILDTMVHKGAMTEEERDKILRNLKGIEWHPYPQEKPTKDGTYLVTIKYEDDEESCVITSVFIETYDSFCGGRFISAWAELPKPYEEGAEE